eukprot:TRINITY_DN8268_c0_g1_i1.p1 TRINITY_DN8268_c0_g1~~TRINITY_DN8268_c0_g1_i1.p1  ORF type:complete len:381 (-),score=103.77 TRINITY_DN8268_c0_g1_i1:152-1201(-)
MDDFGMEKEEAIEDAKGQFEAQGVDLSNISFNGEPPAQAVPVELGDEGIQQLIASLHEHAQNPVELERLLLIVKQNTLKAERNRQIFVSEGLIELLAGTIREHQHLGAFREACTLLRVLTFNDDMRVVAGRGHQHAVKMFEDGVVELLLEPLVKISDSPDHVGEVCATLSKIVVRDDICNFIVTKGGLANIISLLQRHNAHRIVAKNAVAVLKTLAGNDEVKEIISNGPALSLILTVMDAHADNAQTMEQACAALAALMLRNPANCAKVAAENGIPAIVKALRVHFAEPRVVKNACLAIRNMVVRNAELRPQVLAEGTEQLLRMAARTNAEVVDNARAALRDLHVEGDY